MDKNEISGKIKSKAIELGFESCGISKAEKLSSHERFLKNWLTKGLHASMHYMANHFEKRLDPTKLESGTKSVISVLLNYYPERTQESKALPKVAKYAYGKDYHYVIREKLKVLLGYINEELVPCSGRVFTDSAPVLDRAWAANSGLGWIGKNTNLIVPHKGSFFFIGEILIDKELEYDSPIPDMCGSCTKCISACPTNALVTPYLLDSNRCISYQTIENKEDIPTKYKGKFQNWAFGCDICQDVCPWNKFTEPTKKAEFTPHSKLLEMTRKEWQEMDEEKFRTIFKNSAVKRAKFKGLRRNIDFLDLSEENS